jgi:hypothetical protein
MVIISGGMLPLLLLHRRTTTERRPLAVGAAAQAGHGAGERDGEGERGGGKYREEQMGEDETKGIFAYVRQRGVTWHATSAPGARMARLGSEMDPLNSLGTQICILRVWGLN